ncbi:hypothetical protein BXA52_13060, partial [Enterococcus faecium]|uniref:hypothetical protein n=1 Tax=Enterococcus faecium TaxID=1352 RepID=UPI0013F5B7C0
MIAIGQFVFYIPFFIMISILFYYIKWTKKKFSVLLASLPAVYFTYQIFSFRHWETTSVLITHINIRIRIESLACLKRKRLK